MAALLAVKFYHEFGFENLTVQSLCGYVRFGGMTVEIEKPLSIATSG